MVGLGIGVTVSTGLIAFLLIKEIVRRRSRSLLTETSTGSFSGSHRVLDGQLNRAQDGRDAVVLASALSGLTSEQHAELRNTLDEVMLNVSTLRNEVAELRDGLKEIATSIIEDVRKGVEESRRSRRRRHLFVRERSDSMSSNSIYFTASNGTSCPSEAGYTTAYSTAESDYTDRETDRDEEAEEDGDDDDDEEEERSCATVLTLRADDAQSEEDDVEGDEEKICPELAFLLTQSDLLHNGDSGKKAEAFHLLRENQPLYENNAEFLWRLARSYSDMCEHAEDEEERQNYTELGRDVAEAALKKNGLNADCHKWFAVLVGQTSQSDSMHSKLKNSYILKEHLDRALALGDDDPMCFYLMGRWCFEMSRLSWLEQKAAAALYENPPCSSLHLALEYFLKAEELNPGFSRPVRLYIAKCHKELGNHSESRNWAQLALNTPVHPEQEACISGLEAELQTLIDT